MTSSVWQRWLTHSLRHGVQFNSFDLLKLIALVTMVIDHIGYFFTPDFHWLRVVGRIAFPIFLFLIGYSRQWKFNWPLLIAGLILALANAATFHPILPLDILFTILATRALLHWLIDVKGKTIKPTIFVFITLVLWLLPLSFLFDYSTVAVMYALLGYWKRTAIWDIRHYAFLIATLVVHITWGASVIGFDTLQTMATLAEVTILMMVFLRFSVTPVTLPHTFAAHQSWLTFTARNTLFIYAAHIFLFTLLHWWLHRAELTQFRWL